MKEKIHYANGQKIFDHSGEILTYYFQDGKVKAQGKSIDDLMTGEWHFIRKPETFGKLAISAVESGTSAGFGTTEMEKWNLTKPSKMGSSQTENN